MLRVGVTADWQTYDGAPKMILNRDYLEWIRRAGLYPVALPALPGWEAEAVRGLSALVLSGGGDIQPLLYGADPEPMPGEKFSHRDRSAFEFSLVWRCTRMGMPLLGICLGCQTMNVALGGGLIRNLEDPECRHRRSEPGGAPPLHRLRTRPESLAALICPTPDIRVVSSHHQAVGRLAEGFIATAWGPDGVVEAIENAERPQVFGIQWHPERSPRSIASKRLGAWLKDKAETYARSRA
jgi:putative glutamine amidotransferase